MLSYKRKVYIRIPLKHSERTLVSIRGRGCSEKIGRRATRRRAEGEDSCRRRYRALPTRSVDKTTVFLRYAPAVSIQAGATEHKHLIHYTPSVPVCQPYFCVLGNVCEFRARNPPPVAELTTETTTERRPRLLSADLRGTSKAPAPFPKGGGKYGCEDGAGLLRLPGCFPEYGSPPRAYPGRHPRFDPPRGAPQSTLPRISGCPVCVPRSFVFLRP